MVESASTLRELFEAALALPAAERARFIAKRCLDTDSRAAIERLLAADATEGDGLAGGDAASAAQAIGDAEEAPPLPPGSHIGPFELLEVLGEGGSSTVFRAVREVDGVRQQVALKLLARGLYTAEARRRFHHEREALARLRHPGIARLIEGGVADNGFAYIVLELIDGEPITRHAATRGLSERQRLTLFLKVCRAVAAAHRALIVHRDLKPSNVLVTPDGDVKLLDFGIAKLLDDDDATHTQHHALTPAYAAPEQFTPGAVSTATDVYALGVLLRELLGEDVRRASLRVAIGNGDAASPPASSGKLRGDLANIAAKASTREPEHRYGSAGALAEDIERYLDRLPVRAHPPSRWYRAGRFVARHRGGVMVTAALLLATFASLSMALWQAHVARAQAQVAREQAARATMVRDFVEGLFAPLRYGDSAKSRPSLEDLLARGVAQLQRATQLGAAERVDLLAMFSRVYENLGDIGESRKLAGQAVALAQRSLPVTDSNAIRALTARGYAEARDEDFVDAGRDLRLAHQRMRTQGIRGEDLIDLLGPLGAVETSEGHADKALRLAREALAERIATWGANDPRVGIGYNDVASALEGLERYPEASRMWQRTHAFNLAHFGADNNQTTQALSGWASAEWRAGKWNHAHALFTQVLAGYARHGGEPQLPRVYATQKACALDGMRADATSAARDCALAQQLSAQGFGANTSLHGDSLEATAFGQIEAGDFPVAKALFAQSLELYGNAPSNRMRVGRVDSELAGIALLEGKPAQARALLPGAISLLRTRPYKVPPLLAEARLALACSEAPGAGCPRDLQAMLSRDRTAVADRDDPTLLWVDTLMAQADLQHGDAQAARARLAKAIRQASAELPPQHPRQLAAGLWLALAEARDGGCATATTQARDVDGVIVTHRLTLHPELSGIEALLRTPVAGCAALLR